jgi:ribose 5-phosphate isomerase B
MQTIYLGADHRGYLLKEKTKEWLRIWGYSTMDMGASSYEQEDDYPDIAAKVGEKVVADNGLGVLICGSGIGVCVAVNKIKGIRAGLCVLENQARMGRNDDNINVLCLNSEMVPETDNQLIIKAFLETPFGSEERYIRRITKITALEGKT